MFAVEGAISRDMDIADVNDYEARQESRDRLKGNGQYKRLNQLRNALAHGVRPWDQRLTKAMANEADLYATMKGLFTDLIGNRP